MTAKQPTTLSIAVNYNRIGMVFLVGKQPMYWLLSTKAGSTAGAAEQMIKNWLEYYDPAFVVIEAASSLGRKGNRAKMLWEVVKRTVERADVPLREVPRIQPYRNRYDQIDELCQRYPQMKAVTPKRRKCYQAEPPYVTLFDALSLADQLRS